MSAYIRIVLLALMCLCVHVQAAEQDAPGAPDPAALSSDWWLYFEPKEALGIEAFDKRLTDTQAYLDRLRRREKDVGNKQTAQQVEKLRADMDRFAEIKRSAPPSPMPGVATLESYTLDKALERHGKWYALHKQVEAETEDVAWLSSVQGERRKQQSRLRSQYLEMDEQAPERLERGLELMQKRFTLETQRLDLERRQQILKQAHERLEALAQELDNIPMRLQADLEEKARWVRLQDQAGKHIETLQGELERASQVGVDSSAGARDQLEPQFMAMRALSKEIELRIQELTVARALNAQSLAELVALPGRSGSQKVREQIAHSRSLESQVDEQSARWRRMLDRLHAALGGAEFAGKKITANMRDELDKSDQLLRQLQHERAIDEFLVGLLEARLLANEGWWQSGFKDMWTRSLKIGASILNLLGASLFEINETPVTTLGLLRVLLILTATLWASRLVRRAIQRLGERRNGWNQSALYTFGRLVHYVILTIGIIIGLSSIGIDFTKFALFVSALGVGIGFGLQTLISNFVAGLIILFEKSLKVGDFVELESGVTGEVKEINMRSTLITTNDNIDILVPNSEFVGGRVINWTLREAYRRVRVPFGVAYGSDKEQVKKAGLEAAEKVPWTLSKVAGRQPQVWLVEFGDSSLNFELVVWLTPEAVKRPGAVSAAYLWEIESKLKEYNIEIPFPQRDLHLRSAFGLKDKEAREVFVPSKDMLPGTDSGA